MERDEERRSQVERPEQEAAWTDRPDKAEEPGPADALPAWRPFYTAVRDAMRRMRER